MIKLSNRLNTIASLINKDDTVIDIGCDHALLDIYLAEKYKKKYYASDLRESALQIANNNIEKYNSKNVEIKCGNGLTTINNKNIDTAVISGMGCKTIIEILSNKEKLNQINNLIISSNTHPEKIRKYLIKNGFYVYKELLVLDKKKYYTISYFKRGYKIHKKLNILIGDFKSNDVLNDYLDNEIKKNTIVLLSIPKTHILSRIKLRIEILLFKKRKRSIK